MRIAFIGKGGSGKSTLAGTVCRHLASRELEVLALDVDTMPGLAVSLGVAGEEARLPSGLAELVEGKGWRVVKGVRPARLVDRYAAKAPGGIRLLELGKLPGRVEPSVTVAFRYLMERFRRPGWSVIADLAAGTRQPMFRWARFARVVITVVEPSAKSILSARRLRPVATHAVANKIRSVADADLVRSSVDLPVIAAIPYDESLVEAERRGLAPFDFQPQSRAVAAVAELAARLAEELI